MTPAHRAPRARAQAARLAGALALACAALAPRAAWALGPIELGASALLVGGVNTLDQATPASFTLNEKPTTYPGFSGVAGGGGLALELRVFKVIGVEVDGVFSWDFGSGQLSHGDRRASVTIGQKAVHVPILLKGILPWKLVRPFAVAGPELVFALPSKAESDPPGAVRAVVGTGRYTMLTAGLGVELKVPISTIDLRASLSVRGSYRYDSTDDLAERATPLPSGAVILDGRWRYQGLFTSSLGVFF